MMPGRDESDAAAAFAAVTAIQAGRYDRFLLRLRAAIEARLRTDEYRDGVVAGTPRSTRDGARSTRDGSVLDAILPDAYRR